MKMLTIKQLSEIMGMDIHQTERLVKSSGFPSIKIGRRHFVPDEKFHQRIKNNRRSPTPYKVDQEGGTYGKEDIRRD